MVMSGHVVALQETAAYAYLRTFEAIAADMRLKLRVTKKAKKRFQYILRVPAG